MKKIILAVILLAAAGGAAYYLLQKKKQNEPVTTIHKELITGKWKIDSLNLTPSGDSSIALAFIISDTNLHKYEFELDKKGLIIQRFNGTAEDTSHYEFADDNHLLVWTKPDSSKIKFTINKLDSVNMVVQDKDNTIFSFQRIK